MIFPKSIHPTSKFPISTSTYTIKCVIAPYLTTWIKWQNPLYLKNRHYYVGHKYQMQKTFAIKYLQHYHCVKNVRIWSYSGPYLPVFGLNTERCSISFGIQFECRKIWTKITPNTDTFYTVYSQGKKLNIVFQSKL